MNGKELAGALFATGLLCILVAGVLWFSQAAMNLAKNRVADSATSEVINRVIFLCAAKGAVEFPSKEVTIKCEVLK